ncbi:methyltransferase domain-containing protein [Natronomonas salina]|uniref:HemK2/MTQ2 family protein methyltransferase n=1 Tax=Natronomonas salina TaxID=1710540 RepID=UPI0015B6EE50|nr:HemK2/MTQ2 family protein methyltransferase [Natronomonas salina]QLD87968.1 methyltransferase domain-containing protein [Natronomonas salina]
MTLQDRREMPTVYEAAEDSRLLAETVVDRIGGDERVLEVGVGSGYIAGRVAEETGARVVGCDVNPEACEMARDEGVEAVRSNLADPFAADSFDVVLFNPPYLPTPPEEEWDDPLEHALSGGEDGRRVIRPFLADVGRVLRPDGRIYLLISSLTNVDAVSELAADAGLAAREVAEKSFPFERLVVLEITHEHS